MDIEIRDEKKENYILQEGDIVLFNDNASFCTVINEGVKGYILRFMFSEFGATGSYDSLEGLTYSLDGHNHEIYPQSEYKLVLERK